MVHRVCQVDLQSLRAQMSAMTTLSAKSQASLSNSRGKSVTLIEEDEEEAEDDMVSAGDAATDFFRAEVT